MGARPSPPEEQPEAQRGCVTYPTSGRVRVEAHSRQSPGAAASVPPP